MKKFKDLVKQNPEPARGKSGTNPMDPWNAKSGLAEASEQQLLHRYLKSRGINPDYIPKDTKISHSKSSAFLSWRKAHEFDESVEILEATDKADTLTFDIPLMIRMLELAREDVKDDMELHRITERLIEIRSKGVLTMDDYDFIAGIKKLKEELEELAEGRMKDIATNAAEDKRLNKMSTLQKFRADAAAREKKHDNIEKNSGGMTSAIDRLEKHMNEEEELDQQINEVLSKDASAGDWIHDFIHSDNPKFAGKSKKERQKMALGAYYAKQNEEVEQIDEISKKTVKSWLSKQPVVPAKKPGMDKKAHNQRIKVRSKSWDSAIDRLTDRKPTSEEVEPIEEATKKEWSKSARMIKALYKKKGMKEETYDWEKDDKNMQVTGKKPKLKGTPDVDNVGENKPDARAVLTGGKTMTGEKRDDVEIDPFMMKPKNNTPDDFDKPIGRKDK
jgi:hypothetical protein